MKRFVGISSILLLSSILANTGTSLVLAKETKEEAKVVDTTKDKKEKTASSKEESSTKEKETRDIEEPTIESSAVEEVNGTPQLQDLTKDLMDKITDSTKENEDSKEETSKEDKEKSNQKEDEKKNAQVKSLLKNNINPRYGFNLDDWTYDIDYRNQRIILNKYIGTDSVVTIEPTYDTFLGDFNIVIAQHALQNDPYISEIHFRPQYGSNNGILIWNSDPKNPRPSDSVKGFLSNMSKLKVIDLAGLETSHISDFSSMFKNCTGLQTVDLSKVNFADNTLTDPKYFTDFTSMFEGCSNIYQVNVGNIPNHAKLTCMFANCTVLFADLQFRNSKYVASDTSQCFYLPDNWDNLPLLIQSNSDTFLNNEKTWKKGYYTYKDFASDARVLPCIITSGPNGMFADIKDGKYHGKYGVYPVTFDIPGQKYDEKDHWHNAKISMVLTTNGYATKKDPTDSLKKAQTTIKYWEKDLKAFPVLHSNDAPYYIEDKSQFYIGYFANQSDDRWKPWAKTFANIPDYLKNIFLKEEAQYAPVNPEMEKGHVIDSKDPNSKTWPDNRIPQGRLGFTYQPAAVTSDITLQEAGQPLSGKLQVDGRTKSAQDDGLFHVGIRDFEKRDDDINVGPKWTLNAKYHATNPLFRGSYIGFDQNTVRFNLNNINNKTNQSVPFNVNQLTSSYKPNPSGNKVISLKGVTSTSQRKLPDGKSIQLMTSNGNQVQQFYDFTLGNLTLNIPQDHGIMPQKDPTTVGQIDWNLTTGPNGN